MQRELEHRLAIGFFALKTRQGAREGLEVEMVDGILELVEPVAHLLLVDMLRIVVVAIALDLMVLTGQPATGHIVELVIVLIHQLILVLDVAGLKAAEIDIFVRRVVVGNTAKLLVAMCPEHTFRVLSPSAPFAHRHNSVDIVRHGDIALQLGNLFADLRLVGIGDLIHVQEGNEFLPVNGIVHTVSFGITLAVVHVLAIEHSQIVVDRACFTHSAQRMLDHEALEGQIMGVFPAIVVTVQQRGFLALEIGGCVLRDRAVCMVEVPDVVTFDHHRILGASTLLVSEIEARSIALFVQLVQILAVGRGLHFDDVDLIVVLVVDIHIAAVDMAVVRIFKQFLPMHIQAISHKCTVEILPDHLQRFVFHPVVIREQSLQFRTGRSVKRLFVVTLAGAHFGLQLFFHFFTTLTLGIDIFLRRWIVLQIHREIHRTTCPVDES